MSWIPVLPVLLVTVGLVIVPGFVVALALRFRGFSALALAPAFSSAVVGFFGVLAGLINLEWSIWVYAGGTALTSIAAWVATALWKKPDSAVLPAEGQSPNEWRRMWVPLAAVAIAAAMVSRRVMQLVGQPENFAQNFDNVFHLNAIRHILETGNASSLTLGEMQGEGSVGVYPAVWHSYAALVVQLTDASVALAENSINIVSASVIWTLACVFFARMVFGNNPVITLAAGVLSAVQVAFPFSLLVWGPLFPNTLATSMLPLLLGIIVVLCRKAGPDESPGLLRSWWIALLLALAGAATAHMSIVNAVLVFALPLLLTVWWQTARRRFSRPADKKGLVVFGVCTVLGAAAGMLLWLYLRPAFYDSWGPNDSMGGAIGEALTNSPMGTPVNWLVTALVVAGSIFVFQTKKHRWLFVSYAVSVAFYVVDASVERGFLRNFLTGNWYQDTNRLAAFLPVFATVLGALGVWAIIQWIRNAIPGARVHEYENRWERSMALRAVSLTVMTAGLAVAGYFGPVQQYIQWKMSLYTLDESSPLLTPSELELVDDIADYVPEDSVIAVNPWNGSSMAYAFGGRTVLTPHMFASADPERILISAQLSELDESVCAALAEEDVDFVLDFGTRALADTGPEYAGVMELAGTPGFELVKSTGPEANLYKITGCE